MTNASEYKRQGSRFETGEARAVWLIPRVLDPALLFDRRARSDRPLLQAYGEYGSGLIRPREVSLVT
jgi:hypothetical protein